MTVKSTYIKRPYIHLTMCQDATTGTQTKRSIILLYCVSKCQSQGLRFGSNIVTSYDSHKSQTTVR